MGLFLSTAVSFPRNFICIRISEGRFANLRKPRKLPGRPAHRNSEWWSQQKNRMCEGRVERESNRAEKNVKGATPGKGYEIVPLYCLLYILVCIPGYEVVLFPVENVFQMCTQLRSMQIDAQRQLSKRQRKRHAGD